MSKSATPAPAIPDVAALATPTGFKPIGVDLVAGKDYWYCQCGLSKNQPWCDGSHKGSGLSPLKFTPTESKTYWICACRQSSNRPFCDGTHSKEKGIKKYNEFLLKRNTELKLSLERAQTKNWIIGGIAALAVAASVGYAYSRQ